MTKTLSLAELVQLRLAHLGMIQAVVTRMSGFSAGIKNFCVTITVALAALWLQKPNSFVLALDMIVIISFAALDAYYLAVERHFVSVYKRVSARPIDDATDLAIPGPTASFSAMKRATISLSIVGFYVPFLAALVLLMALTVSESHSAPVAPALHHSETARAQPAAPNKHAKK
jgi:hypothetical protein